MDLRLIYVQASKHPFVTGEPFMCPFKPPPETPHMVSMSLLNWLAKL